MIKEKKKIFSQSRRDFFKTLSGAAASVLLYGSCSRESDNKNNQGDTDSTVYGPRVGVKNPFVTNSGKPILVCIEGVNFSVMLTAGLAALGGLQKLVNQNQDVLIKPNLLEASQYPWISSLDSIGEIIAAVKDVSTGQVRVGDMSYEVIGSVYSHLGFESAINGFGGIPLTFSEIRKVRRDTWSSTKPDFEVYADVYDAPILISTCVLKNHLDSGLTCAIKNNVGTIRGSFRSSTRAYIHDEAEDFHSELAEVAGLSNPDLTIVDARSIVTKRGPSFSQNGTVVDLNKIIICGDIVATDAYCTEIMKENDNDFFSPPVQKTLNQAQNLGLGTRDLSQVEIIEIKT